MRVHLRSYVGRMRWSAVELYRDLFVENSDQKKLERALNRLHEAAHRVPLNPEGRKVVIFSLRAWISMLAYEGVMAARLRSLGHRIAYYTCRNDLSFCMHHNVNLPEKIRLCDPQRCLLKDKWIDRRYPCHSLGPMSGEAAEQCRLVDGFSVNDCKTYSWRGLDVGRFCVPSVQWYFRRSYFTNDDVDTWRSFVKSSIHVLDRFDSFLAEAHPDVVVFFSGAMFAERIGLELCRRRNVRAVTWGHGGWLMRFVAAQNEDVATACDLARESLGDVSFSPRLRKQAAKLLARWKKEGGYAAYVLWKKRRADRDVLRAIVADDERPFAVAYTNTAYETAILAQKRIYNNQFEWSAMLVRYFRAHPEYRLIIRVHPAESVLGEWTVREWYLDRMKEYVEEWPPNVVIVPADATVSSYGLADAARVALTYVSTIGMELVYRKVPVITAACCHYERRGFTCDPQTEEEYLAELDRHMKSKQQVSAAHVEALEKYIAWLIYVRFVDFEPLERGEGESYTRGRKIAPGQVFSGKLKNLEDVCSLIVDGREWWSVEEMVRSGKAVRMNPSAVGRARDTQGVAPCGDDAPGRRP